MARGSTNVRDVSFVLLGFRFEVPLYEADPMYVVGFLALRVWRFQETA